MHWSAPGPTHLRYMRIPHFITELSPHHVGCGLALGHRRAIIYPGPSLTRLEMRSKKTLKTRLRCRETPDTDVYASSSPEPSEVFVKLTEPRGVRACVKVLSNENVWQDESRSSRSGSYPCSPESAIATPRILRDSALVSVFVMKKHGNCVPSSRVCRIYFVLLPACVI